jgi:DNA-binding NarL/FixJ family response regulator
MIKIFIADDHILIREGFKKIIDNETDMKTIGDAKNAEEIMNFVKNNTCDVIVLDIGLPDRNGLDVLKDIKAINRDIKVLILSMHPEERFALRALKSGALGYITKESAPEELVKAIRKVVTGRQYISETLSEQLAINFIGESEIKPHETLSDREFQVLVMIGNGKPMSLIADELSLSVSTINTYRQRILEKIKLNSNAGIIHYVLKNGLAD